METKRKIDFDIAVGTFLKYKFQANDKVYEKDILNFITFLKLNELEVANYSKRVLTLLSFLEKYKDLFEYDPTTGQVVLGNENLVEDLLTLKEVMLKNRSIDTFTVLKEKILEMEEKNKAEKLEQLRQVFITQEEATGLSDYIYVFENYEELKMKNLNFVEIDGVRYLKKMHRTESGVILGGHFDYEEIPDLNQNSPIGRKIIENPRNFENLKSGVKR